MTNKCGFCKDWEGDKRNIESIAFCKIHKIFMRGTRNACDDFKIVKCGFCKKWTGDKINTSAFCKLRKELVCGLEDGCNDFKYDELKFV